jgi:hypothetical protein
MWHVAHDQTEAEALPGQYGIENRARVLNQAKIATRGGSQLDIDCALKERTGLQIHLMQSQQSIM